MIKFLKSELSRLFKNILFYILLVIFIILPVGATNTYSCAAPTIRLLETALVSAFFTLLFVSGLFRNRPVTNIIASGVTKTQIYLTELILSVIISFLLTLPMLLFFATNKYYFGGFAPVPVEEVLNPALSMKMILSHGYSFLFAILAVFALCFFVTALFSAFSVFIALTMKSSIKSIVVFLALTFFMYIVTVEIDSSGLYEPPYRFDEETIEVLEKEKDNIDTFNAASLVDLPGLYRKVENPLFISGAKRVVLRLLDESNVLTHVFRLRTVKVDFYNGQISVEGKIKYASYYSSESDDYEIYGFDAHPKTPLEVIKLFHMEYCVAALAILNIFGFALFRKSNLS